MAWGLWRVPESRSRWLGPVRGKRILEVGCGAARWSIALRRVGAHVVGFDQSWSQLAKAARLASTARVPLPIVRGNAEHLPFPDGYFDIAFCDWGALTFSDPRLSIPECARVLRRGGILVFATGTLWGIIALDPARSRMDRRLRQPYFGPLQRKVDDLYEYRPTTSEWIDLFSRNGFVVERLSETRPGPDDRSRYLGNANDERWGRSWPYEMIWRVRKL